MDYLDYIYLLDIYPEASWLVPRGENELGRLYRNPSQSPHTGELIDVSISFSLPSPSTASVYIKDLFPLGGNPVGP